MTFEHLFNKQVHKAGRPQADPVDKLRARAWYLAVKARGGWTDYQLDVEFARNDDETPRAGADRRRAFEAVRKNGTLPTDGTHHRRSFDLVSRVEAHPNFVGTARVFKSPFWTLLKARTMALPEAQAFAAARLAEFRVFRPSTQSEMSILALRPSDARHLSRKMIYQASAKFLFEQFPLDLDLLALIGGLFREAYLVCALDVAATLKDLFLHYAEAIELQEWMRNPLANDFMLLTESRVLYWQMGSHFLGDDEYYDDWAPSVVERPLLHLSEEAYAEVARWEASLAMKSDSVILPK